MSEDIIRMARVFNDWLNTDLDTTENPYRINSAAYWAWEGWKAGAAAERERIKAANAPEIEKINAHIKALDCAAAIRARSKA